MGHHGPVSNRTPSDPVPAPDPGPGESFPEGAGPADPERIDPPDALDDEDEGFAEGNELPSRPGRLRPASGARGSGRLVRPIAAILIVGLVFGSGIVVGRATAPAWSPAASSAPASSEAAAVGSSTPSAPPSAAPSPTSPIEGLPSNGPLLGSPSAKVLLTYWADYQCPFCARFAETALPLLASRIADGTVAVLHRDFVFLGPESLDAAIAVRCAGEQGKYWEMHDAVYAAQNGENQGTFSQATLTRLATGVGADEATYTACTQRQDVLVEVLADTAAGVRASVTSTPTVDIPGRTFAGVPDITALIAAVDAAAKSGATPTPAPSVRPSGDPWADTATSGRAAGPSSAPVTVELWVDYQATGMPAIAQTLEPELRTRIAAGKVRLVLRDLATLGSESALAASFIRCGADDGERTAWFAHDILSVSAQGAETGVFTTRGLLWLAAKLGWDVTALDACMTSPATASAIEAETAVGTGMGLKAAPAVVVRAHGKEVARFSGSSLDPTKVLAAVDAAAK